MARRNLHLIVALVSLHGLDALAQAVGYPPELTRIIEEGQRAATAILSSSHSEAERQRASDALLVTSLAKTDWPKVLKLTPEDYTGPLRATLVAFQFYYGSRTHFTAENGLYVGAYAPSAPPEFDELASAQSIKNGLNLRIATLSEFARIGVADSLRHSNNSLPIDVSSNYYADISRSPKFLAALDTRHFNLLLDCSVQTRKVNEDTLVEIAIQHLTKTLGIAGLEINDPRVTARVRELQMKIAVYEGSQRGLVGAIARSRRDLHSKVMDELVAWTGQGLIQAIDGLDALRQSRDISRTELVEILRAVEIAAECSPDLAQEEPTDFRTLRTRFSEKKPDLRCIHFVNAGQAPDRSFLVEAAHRQEEEIPGSHRGPDQGPVVPGEISSSRQVVAQIKNLGEPLLILKAAQRENKQSKRQNKELADLADLMWELQRTAVR